MNFWYRISPIFITVTQCSISFWCDDFATAGWIQRMTFSRRAPFIFSSEEFSKKNFANSNTSIFTRIRLKTIHRHQHKCHLNWINNCHLRKHTKYIVWFLHALNACVMLVSHIFYKLIAVPSFLFHFLILLIRTLFAFLVLRVSWDSYRGERQFNLLFYRSLVWNVINSILRFLWSHLPMPLVDYGSSNKSRNRINNA